MTWVPKNRSSDSSNNRPSKKINDIDKEDDADFENDEDCLDSLSIDEG